MKFKYTFVYIVCFFCYYQIAQAQQTVLAKPLELIHPEYDKNNSEQNIIYYQEYRKKDKDKEEPWVVFSDREGSQSYTDNNGKGSVSKTLKFKESFYVLDEEGAYLHLIKGATRIKDKRLTVTGGEDYGWVHKQYLILWNNPIVTPNTKIDRKAMLMNSIADGINPEHHLVPLYKNPDKSGFLSNLKIYDIFFILKVSDDGSMYLIADNFDINSINADRFIKGWVPKNRAVDWDTRITLEPNFNCDALQERMKNPTLRINAYSKFQDAVNHNSTGQSDGEIVWKNDPASDKKLRPLPDTCRMRGEVVRFPALNNDVNQFIWRTAIIGKAGPSTEAIEKSMSISKNVNIMFVVDASSGMDSYIPGVQAAISQFTSSYPNKESLKMGVLFYRDIKEENHDGIVQILPLTHNFNSVINYISGVKGFSYEDVDAPNAMFYGVDKAIKNAGFADGETNVVVIVGASGSHERPDKTMIFPEDITEELVSLDNSNEKPNTVKRLINVIAIQVNNKGGLSDYTRFVLQFKQIISESAKNAFGNTADYRYFFPENSIGVPELRDDKDGGYLLSNSIMYGHIHTPGNNEDKIAADGLDKVIQSELNDFLLDRDLLNKNVLDIINEGTKLEGKTAGAVLQILIAAGYTPEQIKKMTSSNFQFAYSAYLPCKIAGAKYPALSYVLFMPSYDLDTLLQVTRNLVAVGDGTPSEKREKLYALWMQMAKQYTGLSERDLATKTIEDLTRMMQGINKGGCLDVCPSDGGGICKYSISDIMDKNRVSDVAILQYIREVSRKEEALEAIKRQGTGCDYCFVNEGRVVYWVPIELLP